MLGRHPGIHRQGQDVVRGRDMVEEAAMLVIEDQQRALRPQRTAPEGRVDPCDQLLAGAQIVGWVVVVRLGEEVIGLDERIARQLRIGALFALMGAWRFLDGLHHLREADALELAWLSEHAPGPAGL